MLGRLQTRSPVTSYCLHLMMASGAKVCRPVQRLFCSLKPRTVCDLLSCAGPNALPFSPAVLSTSASWRPTSSSSPATSCLPWASSRPQNRPHGRRPSSAPVGTVAFRIIAALPTRSNTRPTSRPSSLLFSMMLIVGNLHWSDLFEWNAEVGASRRLKPSSVAAGRHLYLRGFLSAFFVNDMRLPGHGSLRPEHHAQE